MFKYVYTICVLILFLNHQVLNSQWIPNNFKINYFYRELCGDLIVSGHTISLFMAALALKQYCPKKFYYLAELCYCATFIAVPCILLARKHYTIDVVLAYCLTTRVFWTYHSLSVLFIVFFTIYLWNFCWFRSINFNCWTFRSIDFLMFLEILINVIFLIAAFISPGWFRSNSLKAINLGLYGAIFGGRCATTAIFSESMEMAIQLSTTFSKKITIRIG